MTKTDARTAAATLPGDPLRLLLVEADAGAASHCAEALAHMPPRGAEIVAVADGRAAGARLRAEAFDVVLADIGSLRDCGVGAEAAVARLARAAGTALVVALSEGASVSNALAAMRGGAHDHVAKPATGAALAARIAELARRHGRPWTPAGPPTPADRDADAAPPPPPLPSPAPGPILPMWRQEQRIIEEALSHFSGNIARAAAALEISPSTIYRKRQAWDADSEGRRGAA